MRNTITLLLFMLPGFLLSQSWDAGIMVNAANYQGDLVKPAIFTLKETSIGAGLFLRRNVDTHWALRANVNYATITGSDANFFREAERRSRNFSFRSSLLELSAQIEASPLGALRSDGTPRQAFPYFFAGMGFVHTNPTVNFNTGTTNADPSLIAADRVEVQKNAVTFPLGLGFRFELPKAGIFGIEIGFRPTQTDYLDGISRTGNPNKKDWYVLGGVHYAYRFGVKKDADGDGVTDRRDACPEVPGDKKMKGCPVDTDGDGVYDKSDRCPTLAGDKNNGGCPQMAPKDREALTFAVKNINFETNSAILTANSNAVLDTVAAILKRYDYYAVSIEGHTDNVGDDVANLKLSKARAQSCFDYLVKNGIAPARMRYNGFGEARPLASNDVEEGRLQNRRVEFMLSVKK